MVKTVRDVGLESPKARERLVARPKPYFRILDHGLHLGYRKGKRGGAVWVIRRYLGDEQYEVEAIGNADDRQAANGVDILNFWQAQDVARNRHKAEWEMQRRAEAGPDVTVATAIRDYAIDREARVAGQRAAGLPGDARYRLTKHILGDPAKGVVGDPELANKSLSALTADDLATWRVKLAASMAPSSVIRTSSDLKAALNAAARKYRSRLPSSLPSEIKDGLRSTEAMAPVAREAQVLTDSDIRAIIAAAMEVDAANGWEGDLLRLVVVLAATGARFGQIVRQTVADVQTAQGRLMVPVSNKGRGRKPSGRIAVRVGADVLELLRPSTAGRRGPDRLLVRPRWKQTGAIKWEKVGREPWINASELTRPWKTILARAGLAADVVPYALRHSSIVRGLREGLPVRLVAALHDTSSVMIERHYSAFIVDAMDELAARAVVPLVPEQPTRLREVV